MMVSWVIGVPPVILSISNDGISPNKNHPAIKGYPHFRKPPNILLNICCTPHVKICKGLSTSVRFFKISSVTPTEPIRRCFPQDVITFNAAIAACEKASRWRHALHLFFQARDSGGSWETKTTWENAVNWLHCSLKSCSEVGHSIWKLRPWFTCIIYIYVYIYSGWQYDTVQYIDTSP